MHGALHLSKAGEVDGDRLAISGGSAGGYTVLAALTFKDVFKAGKILEHAFTSCLLVCFASVVV